MTTEYQYIRFEQEPTPPKRKTQIWTCRNRNSGNVIAGVYYDTGWRQYVCTALAGPFSSVTVIFSAGCLKDIAHFLEQLNTQQKLNLSQQKGTTHANPQTLPGT